MFIIHQIVNILINPVFDILALIIVGILLNWKGRVRVAKWFVGLGVVLLFILSWPPVVDLAGIWLEKDYPAAAADAYPAADAIVVLGGGVGMAPDGVEYPYPLMADAADRVWHGARLWHAQRARNPHSPVKIYCTGPDVGKSTPPLLQDFGVPGDAIFTFDDPRNTEAEAKLYAGKLQGKTVLLVTSALHMKRSMMIFRKYAPGITVVPAATDHHFLPNPKRFCHWQYYFPNLGALDMTSAIEHELVGLLRYAW